MNFTGKPNPITCDNALDSEIRIIAIGLQLDVYYYAYYSPQTMVGDGYSS